MPHPPYPPYPPSVIVVLVVLAVFGLIAGVRLLRPPGTPFLPWAKPEHDDDDILEPERERSRAPLEVHWDAHHAAPAAPETVVGPWDGCVAEVEARRAKAAARKKAPKKKAVSRKKGTAKKRKR